MIDLPWQTEQEKAKEQGSKLETGDGHGHGHGKQDTIQEKDNGDEASGDFAEVDCYPDYEAIGDEDGNYAYDEGGAFDDLDFEEAWDSVCLPLGPEVDLDTRGAPFYLSIFYIFFFCSTYTIIFLSILSLFMYPFWISLV